MGPTQAICVVFLVAKVQMSKKKASTLALFFYAPKTPRGRLKSIVHWPDYRYPNSIA